MVNDSNKNKVYFASDVHLGAPTIHDSITHEKHFVDWLDSIKSDASILFLMGDIFDFWYEYKYVVPRGFVRTLGKLAELVDSGIEVHFFIGNHDIWTFGYLEKEIGLIVHKEPDTIKLNGKSMFLAHGDGLGDPNKGFKLLKILFNSNIAQQLFSRLIHPNLAFRFGFWWSGKSRKSSETPEYKSYMGEDKEHLIQFSKSYINSHEVDFFIFGHRHIPLDLALKNDSRVIILGDWIHNFTYGVWDGTQFKLESFIQE